MWISSVHDTQVRNLFQPTAHVYFIHPANAMERLNPFAHHYSWERARRSWGHSGRDLWLSRINPKGSEGNGHKEGLGPSSIIRMERWSVDMARLARPHATETPQLLKAHGLWASTWAYSLSPCTSVCLVCSNATESRGVLPTLEVPCDVFSSFHRRFRPLSRTLC